MDCPHCKNQLKVTATTRGKRRVCRILKCKTCDIRFTSEEVLYDISTERGEELFHATYRLKNEQNKLNAAMVKLRSKTKEKRKVAGPPKPVKEGEVYLTYDEIFTKFMKRDVSAKFVSEYRPYPLLNYAIVIFYTDHSELVFQYDPECDQFNIVKGAMTYEDIIAGKWRKKP